LPQNSADFERLAWARVPLDEVSALEKLTEIVAQYKHDYVAVLVPKAIQSQVDIDAISAAVFGEYIRDARGENRIELWTARADINNDGVQEPIYKYVYRPTVAAPADTVHVSIHVLRRDDPNLAAFTTAVSRYSDIFRWRGATYALDPGGDAIYRGFLIPPSLDQAETICRFTFPLRN
jgi:hypothetical protein